MSNRIDEKFSQLASQGKKAFIAYITAGDPDLETSLKIAETLAQSGVDIVEMGIPFSDPLADGMVIQLAAQRALEGGATLQKILDGIQRLRERAEVPIVLFTYYNPVYKFGLEKLISRASQVGVDGLLILDLPPEEALVAADLIKRSGMKQIALIAPTTPEERIDLICAHASGFIYYISREGVTGMQATVSDSLGERLALIRKHSALPVAVGFGVSNPEQARQVAQQADGVVVGSAIVNEIAQYGKSPDILQKVEAFVRPIAQSIQEVKSTGADS